MQPYACRTLDLYAERAQRYGYLGHVTAITCMQSAHRTRAAHRRTSVSATTHPPSTAMYPARTKVNPSATRYPVPYTS
jgi:hypothetical protein